MVYFKTKIFILHRISPRALYRHMHYSQHKDRVKLTALKRLTVMKKERKRKTTITRPAEFPPKLMITNFYQRHFLISFQVMVAKALFIKTMLLANVFVLESLTQ